MRSEKLEVRKKAGKQAKKLIKGVHTSHLSHPTSQWEAAV
jgi:hypothetical protein